MNWKRELLDMLDSGCTDSDIEEFVDAHPDVPEKEIWYVVAEDSRPIACRGCMYVHNYGESPCNRCSRQIIVSDNYKPITS